MFQVEHCAKRLNVFTLCNNSVVSKSNLSKINRPCKFNITKKYTGHLPNSKTVGIYLERYFGRLDGYYNRKNENC